MKGTSGADDRQGRYLCKGCPAHVERPRVLLEAWAELPESVKTAVMEMVGVSVVSCSPARPSAVRLDQLQ